ncbi:MAG: sulfoxide reductase heme-binding subunit YedZ [Gammaproteobacteria bacterium]|nr:sulfoxide reductase heme-binding subunit YedZ [Gammaproteobacteria bacterium]
MKAIIKKAIIFLTCLIPLFIMIYQLFTNQLGAEPVIGMLKTTGIWALRLLIFTLAITPLRRFNIANLIPYRRMIGLFVMFYACLHLMIYVTFEFSFDIGSIAEDIMRRKFILAGMLAFVLLIPLTVTSTKSMMKRLGKKWITLHKSIYWIAALASLHFIWLVKSDYTEPTIYAILFVLLMAFRMKLLRRA